MLRLVVMLLCVTVTPAIADPIVLRDMGSFHIGGRVVEISGRPVQQIVRVPGGPPSRLDPNGRYQVEQMYVQFFLPRDRKGKYPLLLWHGGGLTGASFETTPDGREGFVNMFIRKGWDVYVSDAVERGRSGFASPDIWIGDSHHHGSVRTIPHRYWTRLVQSGPRQAPGDPRQSIPGRGLRSVHEAGGATLAFDR